MRMFGSVIRIPNTESRSFIQKGTQKMVNGYSTIATPDQRCARVRTVVVPRKVQKAIRRRVRVAMDGTGRMMLRGRPISFTAPHGSRIITLLLPRQCQ